jgi:hypothetical protein
MIGILLLFIAEVVIANGYKDKLAEIGLDHEARPSVEMV